MIKAEVNSIGGGEYMTQQKLFAMVKEIKETTDINEVNLLIQKGWILLNIAPNQTPVYSMGRTES